MGKIQFCLVYHRLLSLSVGIVMNELTFFILCSGTLSDRAGVHDHGLVYKAGSVIPDKQEMVNGLEMMAPLLTNLETAMSR